MTIIEPSTLPSSNAESSKPSLGNPFFGLGYEHGLHKVAKELGEQALDAEASAKWQEFLSELSGKKEQVANLSEKKDEEKKHLLPSLGRHPVSILRKLEVFVFFPLVAVLAVFAETPLAGVTFAQSKALGDSYVPNMRAFTFFAFYALVVATPLLGFAFEACIAAFENRRNWKTTIAMGILPVLTVILAVCFITNYAKLRGAISDQTLASSKYEEMAKHKRDVAEANHGTISGSNASVNLQVAQTKLDEAGEEARSADAQVAAVGRGTFEYLTWALYGLIGSCMILFFHRAHDYRIHTRALIALRSIEPSLAEADTSLVRLESRFQTNSGTTKTMLEALADFTKDALARYREGYARGVEECQKEFDKLPLYTRLQIQREKGAW